MGRGVDGSAWNDGGGRVGEVRQAMRVSRVRSDQNPDAAMLRARGRLALAARGCARGLGRDGIGILEVGKAADIIAFDMNRLEYAGAQSDPVAALVFCSPTPVSFSMVNGKILIQDGSFVHIDIRSVTETHNRLSKLLCAGV